MGIPDLYTIAVASAAIAMLVRHVAAGTRHVVVLRRNPEPEFRAAWFAARLRKQALTFFVTPILALTLTGTWGQAFHPAMASAMLTPTITALTGLTRADLADFLNIPLLIQLGVMIVVIELIPLLLRSHRVIGLGNFAALRPRTPRELPPALVLAIGAGVGEELMFRGFLPAVLLTLGLPPQAAFLIPLAGFAAGHVYQGPVGVLATGFAGAMLTSIYLLSGNLFVAMACHATIDIVGLVLRPAVGMILARILRAR